MRIIGYVMLHYGSEYFDACIRSLDAICERIMIYYSARPTHNPPTFAMDNPDSEDKLRAIAEGASRKIIWKQITAGNEGEHRSKIFRDCQGFDMIATLDSDEVLELRGIENVLNEVMKLDCRYIGVNGFVNFWRSFNWQMIDYYRPVRFHNLKTHINQRKYQENIMTRIQRAGLDPDNYDGRYGPITPEVKVPIYHFGYAQSRQMVEYKINIHGHKGGWKQDWFDKWLSWTPQCTIEKFHPESETVWLKADPFDKTTLPDMLKNHPYYNLELI